MQIIQKTEFNLRSCILGNLLLLALAMALRIVAVMNHGVLSQFSPQIIHGSLADLAIPFAVLFLAAFKAKKIYFQLSIQTTYLFTLLTAIDFFHYLKFGSRITFDLLLNDSWLWWLRQDRVIFLPMLFVIWLCFFIIRKVSLISHASCTRHNLVFLLCAMILLALQTPSLTPISTIKDNNSELFLENKIFDKKNDLAMSSFHCLFKLRKFNQKTLLLELLSDPAIFDRYLNQYEKHARLAANKMNRSHQTKIWPHQGFKNSMHSGNSLQAFAEAIKSKFPGVELDINYLDETDRFVVCHDLPQNREMYQLLPDLENYFTILSKSSSNDIIVWLDFKNLDYRNNKQALRKLHMLAEKYKVLNSLMIESNDALLLRDFSRCGFKTIWAMFYEMADERLQQHDIRAAKALAALSGCQMISLPWQVADEYARSILTPMPLAIYTVNEVEKLKEFISFPEIYVILSDMNGVD
ncbi:MAG TPA: hypothetical protein PKV88_03350 [Bacteroidales bacterium]|nr:hypothetical protein [Bacteroidales bacterium]